jgi:hypothetical protein
LKKLSCPENSEKKIWDAVEPEVMRRLRNVRNSEMAGAGAGTGGGPASGVGGGKGEEEEEEGEGDLISLVWNIFCASLYKNFKNSVFGQTKNLQNLFSDEFPRLLRIVFDFLKKLEIHQDFRSEGGGGRREGSGGRRKERGKGGKGGWGGEAEEEESEEEEEDGGVTRGHYNFFKDEVNRRKLISAVDCKALFLNKVFVLFMKFYSPPLPSPLSPLPSPLSLLPSPLSPLPSPLSSPLSPLPSPLLSPLPPPLSLLPPLPIFAQWRLHFRHN